jgi:ATP-dependent helicase/nuclease subunit B
VSVRFVIGRAGSGKTKHCFDAIVDAMRADPLGGPIYWILPKQATFSAERELTTRSGLDGFCRARVLSFELLGEEVLEACGGAAVPELSAVGRQMLLGYLLRSNQEQLQFFRSVARQPGLAARLDATFAEFERCGKDPDALGALAKELAESAGDRVEERVLRDKVADFALLYRAYRDAVGQERVDPHRRLEQVLDCLHDYKPLRQASVYIDGFHEFTDRERRMIIALGETCGRVDVTLLIDPKSPTLRDVHTLPDDLSLFHRTETTYRKLVLALTEAGVEIDPPVPLTKTPRFADGALAEVERSLFDGAAPQAEEDFAVQFVEAPDRRGEVDAVARRIRELLREKGKRLREIAVLVRDIDDYEELISASFREHELPYFVDRRRSAGHHPLLQFTRAVFQIARLNWPHDAVMAVVKSGLVGLSHEQAEALENYVLLHRLHGGDAWTSREPWAYCRTVTRRNDDEGDAEAYADRAEAAAMDALRQRVVSRLMPFVIRLRAEEKQPVRQTIVELFELYARFDVRATLAKWIDDAIANNDPEQRGEHEQVWAELIKLFDQLADLLGDAAVTPADFVEILEAGLDQFDLALTPPRIDQVLVGQVERTRTTHVHTTFVLGLSEGQFPKVSREDTVLSDSERRSLRNRHLDVDPDSERRLLDENLLGYLAFTRASHRLVVTRPASIDNKPINVSAFWSRLRRMFPHNAVVREKRESDAGAEAIGTPRQLVTALMRWARKPDDSADAEQPWATLYQWLADHPFSNDAIDVMRFRAWRAVGYHNEAKLLKETADQLYARELHASVTRIETFAACPFKHYARFSLGLEEREEADVTAMDLGNVYHQILEGVVRRTLQQRADWCEIEKTVTKQMVGELAQEVGHALRGELMLSTARNKYLLGRVRKTVEQVCAAQQAQLSRGGFRPAFAELEFGQGDPASGALPPLELKTPRGRVVRLRGKIDRVDMVRDGTAVAVIDYKLSDRRLSLHEVYHGLSLQLLTYLLVLDASGDALFKRKVTPVAAFYAKLLRSLEAVDHPDLAPDETDPKFDLRVKPRGIFDGRFVQQIDAQLDSGSSEVVQVFITKDGNFGRIDSTDVADGGAFAALLAYVKRRIGELADRLIAGVVEVRPYRIGKTTPCPNCPYRSVCRFDPAINLYQTLPAMKRSQVLELVLTKGGGGGGE